ncbi:hypothetical protein PC116_g30134 [Phytophthora cactorum]|nr:hypothetical protein PC116_g30134 [Phytophthora cactorum]
MQSYNKNNGNSSMQVTHLPGANKAVFSQHYGQCYQGRLNSEQPPGHITRIQLEGQGDRRLGWRSGTWSRTNRSTARGRGQRQPRPGAGSSFDKVARRAKDELGTSLSYHQVDVLEGAEKLHKITEEIVAKEGHIDGLIAAAGIQQETPALDYTAEDSNRMLGVNVTGVLLTAQAVAKHMYQNDTPGSIVLIASMSGTVANRGLICPVYNASKAAVIQLGRNLAMEWGVKNIRVNTISPGYIVTEMVQRLFEKFPDRAVEWPKQNMLNKLSKPEDYRGAAVFLLSDASRFMTGADLRIDGGHAAW